MIRCETLMIRSGKIIGTVLDAPKIQFHLLKLNFWEIN